ncbi:hypothetical protein [Pseudoalteromonas agarivorans]|uniref:Uncharacterized protein n=1 Tax=Pseudoalteromonas agarivorans DSM 14585 TaxID=1312369 RepID=A0ACA8DV66_9GAMM|nr:hypothetical protein [Pseudoalteromonas agarivorans]ATC82105.1 hypothetical protein PAGA_a1735 [Pseudoalteromonas agarivorans DSM 14585]
MLGLIPLLITGLITVEKVRSSLAQQQRLAYRQNALTNTNQFKQLITENQQPVKQFPTLNNHVEIIDKQLSDLQIVRQVADEKIT